MEQGSEDGRVAVIGAGAIGGFFAVKLHEAGHPVTLCVRTPSARRGAEGGGGARDRGAPV